MSNNTFVLMTFVPNMIRNSAFHKRNLRLINKRII